MHGRCKVGENGGGGASILHTFLWSSFSSHFFLSEMLSEIYFESLTLTPQKADFKYMVQFLQPGFLGGWGVGIRVISQAP